MMSESQNGGECIVDLSRQRDRHVRMISYQMLWNENEEMDLLLLYEVFSV